MLKAFGNAKEQVDARSQQVENEAQFQLFIHDTQRSINALLSSGGLTPSWFRGENGEIRAEGIATPNIDPVKDLHKPEFVGFKMRAFIGKEAGGDWITSWVRMRRHAEPPMVVDILISHNNDPETRQTYFISSQNIKVGNKALNLARSIPHSLNDDTRLIADVIQYAVKHPALAGGK